MQECLEIVQAPHSAPVWRVSCVSQFVTSQPYSGSCTADVQPPLEYMSVSQIVTCTISSNTGVLREGSSSLCAAIVPRIMPVKSLPPETACGRVTEALFTLLLSHHRNSAKVLRLPLSTPRQVRLPPPGYKRDSQANCRVTLRFACMAPADMQGFRTSQALLCSSMNDLSSILEGKCARPSCHTSRHTWALATLQSSGATCQPAETARLESLRA